jgi:hypothetical protein
MSSLFEIDSVEFRPFLCFLVSFFFFLVATKLISLFILSFWILQCRQVGIAIFKGKSVAKCI